MNLQARNRVFSISIICKIAEADKTKSIVFRLLIIPILLVFLTQISAKSSQESRIALVIGNGAYKSSPLANPLNDANNVADALRKLGFSVELEINADQRVMEDSIRAFGKKLRSGGIGLFYFAGHGMQVQGRNYLIPIDANIETESEIKYEAVSAGRVLGQMEDAKNGMNIIILDACRDNPYARSFRSSEKGLAKMDAPTGSILAFSTAPGSIAADGVGRNGLYTSKLLKHMMTPGLTIERVLKNVRIEVMKDSGARQVPWESSSLTGDFYFNLKRGIAVVELPSKKSHEPVDEPPKYASISPDVSKPKVIDRDKQFIKYRSKVVYDKNTRLEWYVGPDRGTNWNEAKSWVENLTVAGGGWRMPTRKELNSLYKKGAGKRNMTPLLKTTGWWVWSGEIKGSSSAWVFSFYFGDERWGIRGTSSSNRVFAVRFRR